VLDGLTTYHAWSQNMSIYLKGRKMWKFVTSKLLKPKPLMDYDSEIEDEFDAQLEE